MIDGRYVNAHVVGPFLQYGFLLLFTLLRLRDGNSASVTLMQLLKVIVEVTLCRELFITPGRFALVRTFARVEPEVGLEIPLLEKRFAAVLDGADEVPLSLVLVDVDLQALLSGVGLIAVGVGTLEHTLLLVDRGVVLQVALRHEGLVATGVLTGVRLVGSLKVQVMNCGQTYVNLLVLQQD